jgi:hypothetical protein
MGIKTVGFTKIQPDRCNYLTTLQPPISALNPFWPSALKPGSNSTESVAENNVFLLASTRLDFIVLLEKYS